jgi:hypothetical protein
VAKSTTKNVKSLRYREMRHGVVSYNCASHCWSWASMRAATLSDCRQLPDRHRQSTARHCRASTQLK